jgi:hypothetical protein
MSIFKKLYTPREYRDANNNYSQTKKMIVTLTHIGNSWWWEQHKCTITCSDGRVVDPEIHVGPNTGMAYEVHETQEGIEARYFRCSSGRGKEYLFSKLLIPSKEYCEVKHEGQEPEHPGDDAVEICKQTEFTPLMRDEELKIYLNPYDIIREMVAVYEHTPKPDAPIRDIAEHLARRISILNRAEQFLLTE